jgi:hypothetical protein
VVTELGDGDGDLSIGGAMFDEEPHANRARHKEQDGRPWCLCD